MNCYFVWCILLDKKSVNVAVSIVLIEQIVIGFSYQQVLGSICFDRLQNHVKNLLVSLDKNAYDSDCKTANLYQRWHYNTWVEWSWYF